MGIKIAGFVADPAIMAAGEFPTKPRHLPSTVRRSLLVLGIALAAVVTGLVLVGMIARYQAVREARRLSLFPESPPTSGGALVCRHGPLPDCAQEAARRAEFPVAWMTPDRDYQLRWVVAAASPRVPKDKRLVEQLLMSDEVGVAVESKATYRSDHYRGRLVARYAMGREEVLAYVPKPGELGAGSWHLTFVSEHDGHEYSMFVAPRYPLDPPPFNLDRYSALLRAVRYARPPLGSS